MASIFSLSPGRVVRVANGRPTTAFRVQFEQGQRRRFIVTQASIEQQGNFQLLHTIEDFIYVYVFGDRISELQVSGMAFADTCDGSSGITDALDFYDTNRIARRELPLKVMFGPRLFHGLLVGSRMDIVRPEMPIGQWTFRFNVFPVQNDQRGSNAAAERQRTPQLLSTG